MKQIKKKRVHNRGAAMLIVVIFFVFISVSIALGLTLPPFRDYRVANNLYYSNKSYYLAESNLEDAFYRLAASKKLSSTGTMTLDGSTASYTVIDISSTKKQIIVSASVNNHYRKMELDLVRGDGVSFHYGVQAGQGGFALANSAGVNGNVYSGGTIIGAVNTITGDVVSSGAGGLIKGVTVTGSAFAHTIGATSGSPTSIGKDAYYTTIASSNTTVGGVKYPGSADQPDVPLPIADSEINKWEGIAATGGTMLSSQCDSYNNGSNTCTISSTKTLGPLKIPFNLKLSGNTCNLIAKGHLWITGNISASQGANVSMDPSLGDTNIAIIADNPSNRAGSGTIDINNSVVFTTSGSANSWVFLISQNNSAETGGTTAAITINQSAEGVVAYASHGLVALSQTSNLKELTAYQLALSNSAVVSYMTGLPSVVFSSGPSGGYSITSWKEIQ
jgi:hypothetical protein